MLKKTSKIRKLVVAAPLGALVVASVPGACLAGDDPFQDGRWRDNRCDMVPVQIATATSAAASLPSDMIVGQEIATPARRIAPGIFRLS